MLATVGLAAWRHGGEGFESAMVSTRLTVLASVSGHSPSLKRTPKTMGHSRPLAPWMEQSVIASALSFEMRPSCNQGRSREIVVLRDATLLQSRAIKGNLGQSRAI